jgi:acyl carrier protein
VPRRVFIVDQIPKGPTGKLQRVGLAQKLGLPEDLVAPEPATLPFVGPRSDVEEVLAGLWCEVLNIPAVGIHQRFLNLGGDSMLATRLVARLRQALEIELTLLDFFDAPTIAEQAVIVEALLLDEIEALSEDEARRLAGSG